MYLLWNGRCINLFKKMPTTCMWCICWLVVVCENFRNFLFNAVITLQFYLTFIMYVLLLDFILNFLKPKLLEVFIMRCLDTPPCYRSTIRNAVKWSLKISTGDPVSSDFCTVVLRACYRILCNFSYQRPLLYTK